MTKQIADIYEQIGTGDKINLFDHYFSRGVLRVKYLEDLEQKDSHARPFYVVEFKQGEGIYSQVAVYQAIPEINEDGSPVLDSNGQWAFHRKDHIELVSDNTDTQSRYSDATAYSRLVRSYKVEETKREQHKVRHIDKPLYITDVIHGRDSITGEVGLGFKDYDASMKPTGVFICLDTIQWYLTKARPDDMLDFIKETKREDNSIIPFRAEW